MQCLQCALQSFQRIGEERFRQPLHLALAGPDALQGFAEVRCDFFAPFGVQRLRALLAGLLNLLEALRGPIAGLLRGYLHENGFASSRRPARISVTRDAVFSRTAAAAASEIINSICCWNSPI